MRPEVLAASVGRVLQTVLAPVLTRLATADAASSRHESALAALTQAQADLRERMAVLETRPQLPGPPGPPGRDGVDGLPGKDGTPGLQYCGVYVDGRTYDLGDMATRDGSTWHCNELTTARPGDGSKAWTMMVKRGQNGRDGKGA